MKSFIKKSLIISCVLILGVLSFGCAKKGENLEVSDSAIAASAGIINGITTMDASYKDELLAMEPDEIEDFFKQYGYSIDGKAFLSGVSGYMDAVDEMGGVIDISEPLMASTDDSITATFDVDGVERDAKIVVTLNERNKIESITTNCDYTFAENLRKAGLNTVLGMGTTFVILIFLSLIISLFKFIPDLQDGFAKKKSAAASPAAKAVDNTISQIIEKEEAADDNELIAVITAAIAAYEGASPAGGSVSPSGDGFVVRSIIRR
ncbi:MAG: OadG family protein [Lachnospiraceae bacterium]|nr:OadG family protein [Lachnospiraceae bacterium]